jgi:transposase
MAKTRRGARRKTRKGKDATEGLPPLNLNAAGIDVGNAEHWVAIPPGRAPQTVERFGSFTADLHRLGRWLKACNVDTVVMQATGVYWMGLYQVLEEYGLEVKVVNAHYTKTLPGRKSDVQECQWLQKLHTFGLLNNSFLPGPEIRELRTYLRQRDNLVAAAGTCIQHLQKTLTEMNVQLANVLSDVSGATGMAILRAIVGGERDPQRLARLKNERVRASQEEIAHSLEGNWREGLLFALKQNLELYDFYLGKIAECDREVEAHLKTMTAKVDVKAQPIPQPRRIKVPRRSKHQPCYDLRGELYRVTGVDLTQVDGIDVQTAQTVISEVGVDMSSWPTERHFASWLGLSPDHRISGGRVLKRGTRKVVNRASTALRLAASNLLRSDSALGANFRRLRARLGAPKAVTALAHKLACLIYRMLKFGKEYVDRGAAFYEAQYQLRRFQWLQKQAAALKMQLVPIAEVGR